MRDPVSRFVSATAQEMTGRPQDKKAEQFRKMCLKDNAEDTLKCAIEAVRVWFARQYMTRMHYIPFAVFFQQRAFGHDIPTELYEFDDVRYVLGNFLQGEGLHAYSQEDKANYNGETKDDVMVNMSVSDLTQEMIDEICALYAIDVLLMRHLNMKDEYCKGHVSDKYVSTLNLGKTLLEDEWETPLLTDWEKSESSSPP